MWHGAYLCAQARQRCRRERGAEIDWRLAAGGCFDASEHVGRTAAREIASHEFGRNRNSSPCKFVGGSRCGDLFAVDQHTIAIKNNHGSLTPACSTAVVSTNRGATEGIVGPWQKSGAARPRDFFTQLLRFAGKAGIISRRSRK
jgi:hypothetical protein